MSNSSSREWIKSPYRNTEEYKQGVRDFISFVKNHSSPDVEICTCPCIKCKNSKKLSLESVEKHLIIHGMIKTYNRWFFHGEMNKNNTGVNHTQNIIPDSHIQDQIQTDHCVEGALRNLIDDAFGVHNMPQTSREEDVQEINIDNSHSYHGEKHKKYTNKANEKLYSSCEDGLTTLGVIVEHHNLKKEFNWSGNSMTELLKRLKRWLPKENNLPDKYPTMKKILKDLGMEVKCIHACENDCILFWKENVDAKECPQCHTPRYKTKKTVLGEVKLTKEPRKVLRYFPISPRLSRLYTIPWIAHKMQQHKKATPSWNSMRHPIDSAEWRSVKSQWQKFASEGCNVWLGIATDGFNPNGVLSNSYGCWLIYLIPYYLMK